MSFPLTYLLIPYLVFLGVWLILSLVALYHILRFGSKKIGAVFLSVIYISGSVALATLSYTYLANVDWRNEVSVFNERPSSVPAFEIPTF